MYGKGYGMPSSHAQFVAYFSISLALFLIFRHAPNPSTTYTPTSLPERILLSVVAMICAAAVAASRIYLNYHTPKQVLVGCAAGAGSAVAWFLLTTCLRRTGWIEWGLDTRWARMVRMRDLVVVEDLVDAGWERWEAKRRKRRVEIRTDTKKVR